MRKIENYTDEGNFFTVDNLIGFLMTISDRGYGNNYICHLNDKDEIVLTDHIDVFVQDNPKDDNIFDFASQLHEEFFEKDGTSPVVFRMF